MNIVLKVLSIIGVISFGIFSYCLCVISSEFSKNVEERNDINEKNYKQNKRK